jgi:holo-[acyl-carrier protein] synthase
MIVGVGIDIVSVERIRSSREKHGQRFVEKILTPGEIELCMGRKSPDEGFAARFAAKEAGMKALATGFDQGVGWHDVEVIGG